MIAPVINVSKKYSFGNGRIFLVSTEKMVVGAA